MKSAFGLATLAGALLLALPQAAPAADKIKDKATSSVAVDFPDGVMRVETRTSGFQVVTYWPEGDSSPKHVLLQQTIHVVQREDAEGPETAEVTLAGWKISSGSERTAIFSIEAEGEAAAPVSIAGNDAYVGVTRFGCCGALDAAKLYSLENGNVLMRYVGEPAWLEVPNSRGLVRIAGLDVAWSASFDPLYAKDDRIVGIFTYAARTEPLRRVAIRLAAGPIDAVMSEPEIVFFAEGAKPDAHFTLWSADKATDPKAITGAGVRIAFTPDHVVAIPILADELDLAHATTTGGLALAAMPQD